jgi:flagellin-like protein
MRGLSNVIATVLIILITIVAIVILSSFIIPFVRDGLDNARSCIGFEEHLKFEKEFGYNCYQEGKFAFSIRNLGDDEIIGFRLVLLNGDNSVSLKVLEDNSDLDMLGGGDIEIPKKGEVITYVYQDANNQWEKAEIYPVISGDTCDKNDEIEIFECRGVSIW